MLPSFSGETPMISPDNHYQCESETYSEDGLPTPPQMTSADKPLEIKHLFNNPSGATLKFKTPVLGSPSSDTFEQMLSMVRSISLIKDEVK
jgi:hypothetical protein